MAKYDKQARDGYINVGFTAGEALASQELVEISADFEVTKPGGAGCNHLVGEVKVAADSSGDPVTIATFFTKLRTYTTGAAVVVGAIVLDANNNVINYNAGVHDSAAILGLAMEADAVGGEDINCLVR